MDLKKPYEFVVCSLTDVCPLLFIVNTMQKLACREGNVHDDGLANCCQTEYLMARFYLPFSDKKVFSI